MRAPASTTIPSAAEIVIDCSVPPSLNRLWRVGKGRIYKDKRCARWAWEFLIAYKTAYPKSVPMVEGLFDVELFVCPQRKRDADNSIKGVLDLCQAIGIIRNDSQARKVTQELVEKERAPMGCRLRIIPLG